MPALAREAREVRLIASAWLCWRYAVPVDDAITEVVESALRVGANRDPLEAGPEARTVLGQALQKNRNRPGIM